MFLSDISIKRPVMMTMVVFVFVVIGIFSYSRLGIDLMPDFNLPYATVVAVYAGAGPEEIETLIAKPLEEEISGVSGLKNLYSISQEGYCVVIIEFQLGEDIDIRAIEVKDKIEGIRTNLPDDMENPVVQKIDIGAFPVVDLSVMGDLPLDKLNDLVEDVIKPEISKSSGIATIEVYGEKEREIEIALSAKKLRAYELSPLQVVGLLAAENMNIPSGRIERGRREYTVRMAGEFLTVEEIAAMRIATPRGEIRLDQVADVRDTFAEQRELARFNGTSAIGLGIIKQKDANTVQVGLRINAAIERLKKTLPEGVDILISSDRSVFIRDAVKDVFNNLVMGILFTAFVLFLFLHNWRSTVIAAVAMPISIVSTFTLLMMADFTLNMMSIMGLAVSVGILVVNAVVVLENIERLRKEGMDMMTAASKGVSQVTIAVMASTLTNIAVFAPMAFMQGIIGPIFMQFGLTVAFATLFSLLVSFTLTPMMASKPFKKSLYAVVAVVVIGAVYIYVGMQAVLIVSAVVALMAIAGALGLVDKFSRHWDHWFDELTTDYRNVLRWCINHRFIVNSFVVVVFVFGLFLFKFIGSEFFPSTDERQFGIYVEMPAGTKMEESNRVLMQIESEIKKVKGLSHYYTVLGQNDLAGMGGGEGVTYGNVKVELLPVEEGDFLPTKEVVKEVRHQLAKIPAASIIVQETSQMGGGAEADIEVQLQGEDMDDLEIASNRTIELIRSTGMAVDTRSDWVIGKPEIVIEPNRPKLFDMGGSVQDIAMLMRTNFEGMEATTYREGGDEFTVRVRLQESDRNRVDRIGDLIVPLRGGFVPLKEVATIKEASGPSKISRKNKQRMVTISTNVAHGTMGQLQTAINNALELTPVPASQQLKDIMTGISSATPRPSPQLPKGVTVYYGGNAEMMAESFTSLFQALMLAIILTFMLLAAILESYRYPLIIMATLPLALIGVTMALVITGMTLSMIALMAIIMLVGIVVNNGILLIDYIVELRREGMGLFDAVLEASPTKLRPILMSTIATVLGMVPLALGLGAAGEMRQPMAVVVIGGLIVSTVLTLIVIPVMFVSMEAKAEKKKA